MKKRILSLVLIVTMFITIVPFIASASSYDVLIYSFDDENMTASVIGNNNLSSNDYGNDDLIVQKVVIPETVSENGKTYTVTAIGDKTFYNCYFSSVEIPDTVVSIGNSAFEKCINLKNLIIGTAVQYIGKSAFSKCESLESIEIPESVTYIGEYGFNECSSLRSVSLPDSITTIKESVFNCCVALTSIEIPDSVTTIDKKAFYICYSLENVKIPESVTYIDETAFASCESIVSIDIDT